MAIKLTDLSLRTIDSITKRTNPYTFTIDQISPYAIYSSLRKLGMPNGQVPNQSSQWCYEVRLPQALLSIYEWKLYGCLVDIYPDDQQAASAESIFRELQNLFMHLANQEKSSRSQKAKASAYLLLQNPYQLYLESAEALLREAEQINDQHVQHTFCRSAFFLLLSSFEGLLNLVFEMYSRPEARANEAAYKRTISMPLDQKILFAPMLCMCFTGHSIDFPGDTLQRYTAIRQLRNNFIHANMTDEMRTVIIHEDGYSFLIEPPQTNKQYNLPLVISGLRLEHLHFTKTAIIDMKNALLEAMTPHLRHDFAQALKKDAIIVERTATHYKIHKQL
ncbi:hypothetical protein [Herpetosiphon sp. NSE202]|uniref:hypothetical protein n=1 Tax=Herpetosiphon sp. NSE202 TaxID=3351349 RepID=UPI00362EE403